MKNWMNKPITWGGYMKLTGVCLLIGIAIDAIYIVATFTNVFDSLVEWIKSTTNRITKGF